MLYLESPAGVGFSYSTDPSFYGGVGDSMTGVISMLEKFCISIIFCVGLTCKIILF